MLCDPGQGADLSDPPSFQPKYCKNNSASLMGALVGSRGRVCKAPGPAWVARLRPGSWSFLSLPPVPRDQGSAGLGQPGEPSDRVCRGPSPWPQAHPPLLLSLPLPAPATACQAPEQPFGGSDSSQMLTSEQALAGRRPDRRGPPGRGHGLHPTARARAGFPTAGSLTRTEFRQMLEPTTKASSSPGLRGNTRFCHNEGRSVRPSQTIYSI